LVIFDCEDSCGDICEDRCRDSYEDSCCLLTLLYNSLDCEDRLTLSVPVVRYYCRIEYDIEMKKNSALFPNSQE